MYVEKEIKVIGNINLYYFITTKLIHKIIKFCVITNEIFEKDYYETFLKIQKINISMWFSGYNLT